MSDGLSCVEGTGREMLNIANAIETRGTDESKRCAVKVRPSEMRAGKVLAADVDFWSPRNSNGAFGTVTLAEADDLAALIRATVKP